MPEARRNFLEARGRRFRLAADASFLRFRAGFAAFRTAGVFASVAALAKSNSVGFFIERVEQTVLPRRVKPLRVPRMWSGWAAEGAPLMDEAAVAPAIFFDDCSPG